MPWSDPQGLASRPAAVTWGQGRQDVFVRGMDKALWHIWNDGQQWSDWESLGVTLESAPAVASSAPDRVDVISRGVELVQGSLNALWWLQYTGQSSNWQPPRPEIVLPHDPAVATATPGRLYLFVRGGDNALWFTWFDGQQWDTMESLGGSLASDPAVVAWPDGRLDVFARGTDNALWHITYGHAWEQIGGVLTSSPAAVGWGQGRIDVFARGTDRALWHTAYDGQWSQWESLGGVLTSDPAVSVSGNRLDVFVRGTDSALWHISYAGQWSAWETLGGAAGALLEISRADGTAWVNPAFDTTDPNWSSNLVGGHTFDGSSAHPFEWVSVLRPDQELDDEVGLAGTVLGPHDSELDLPFTHPFGNDFEFAIVPDPAFDDLLAPNNKDENGTYDYAWSAAAANGMVIPTGVLGLEIDGALVPAEYRPVTGERVAAYGRWIVDAGHNDFHAEIHPPLLMGFARTVDNNDQLAPPSEDATTLFRLWSRPYAAGQLFTTDGATGLALQDYCRRIMLATGDVKAFPPLLRPQFLCDHLVAFTVYPPARAPLAGSWELQYSYHFTVNRGVRISVDQRMGALLVSVSLESGNYPPMLEEAEIPADFVRWEIGDLLKLAGPAGIEVGWLSQIWFDIKQAVYVRRFAAPQTSATQDSVNVVPWTPITVPSNGGVSEDWTQPFLAYGWARLRWVRTGSGDDEQMVVGVGPRAMDARIG